ncbi:hypothetical protein PLIIFM63780_010581 [Purpureocillium lilacinum]|nr:hypothetical protein PLIIFM63780_010581 [Purpureocillium lilacinum]
MSPKIDGIGVLTGAADPGGTFGSATTATVDGQDNLAGAGDTGRQKRAIDTSASTTSVDAITRTQEDLGPKRRKIRGEFTAINSNVRDLAEPCQNSAEALIPPRSLASHQNRFLVGPLPGTRPTCVLVGYWRGSNEPEPRDRHAVYGVLQNNDVLRMKVTNETRDGRFVGGNFPVGNGAIWMLPKDVEMENHLRGHGRPVIKEYCRVRQYQLDNGETNENRKEHEAQAIIAAQARCRAAKAANNSPNRAPTARGAGADAGAPTRPAAAAERRVHFAKPMLQPDEVGLQHSLNENGSQPTQWHPTASGNRVDNKRINDDRLAVAGAAQTRADYCATTRERAAAAAAAETAAYYDYVLAATAAGLSPAFPSKGGVLNPTHALNCQRNPSGCQDLLRGQADAEAKVYNGVKYQHKPTGPFAGKLISAGNIITIDGEDYVQYCVLMKPSFFW